VAGGQGGAAPHSRAPGGWSKACRSAQAHNEFMVSQGFGAEGSSSATDRVTTCREAGPACRRAHALAVNMNITVHPSLPQTKRTASAATTISSERVERSRFTGRPRKLSCCRREHSLHAEAENSLTPAPAGDNVAAWSRRVIIYRGQARRINLGEGGEENGIIEKLYSWQFWFSRW